MSTPPIRIAPSLLSADFARLAEQIALVEAGGADWLHVDVMDGHFVPNITLGPVVVEAIRQCTNLPLDVHLMIEEPDRYLADFARAGAASLTVHAEACRHLHRTLSAIRDLGCRAAVALNPHTSLEPVRHVLDLADMVLVMSVNPGFGGQRFIPAVLPKLAELARWIAEREHHIDVEIDGGISLATAAGAVDAGARVLVAGNAVFKAPDVPEAVRQLRAVAERALPVRSGQ